MNHYENRVPLQVRMPPELLAWIKADANTAMRSMNAQILAYLKAAMDASQAKSR
jgi:hypothetical protein